MPQLATEVMLCERMGWTLEYIRSMELRDMLEVIEVLKAIDGSAGRP